MIRRKRPHGRKIQKKIDPRTIGDTIDPSALPKAIHNLFAGSKAAGETTDNTANIAPRKYKAASQSLSKSLRKNIASPQKISANKMPKDLLEGSSISTSCIYIARKLMGAHATPNRACCTSPAVDQHSAEPRRSSNRKIRIRNVLWAPPRYGCSRFPLLRLDRGQSDHLP